MRKFPFFRKGALIPLLFQILTSACSEQPEPVQACLSANQYNAYVGDIISFTNCSENYISSHIDFGDGTSSEISNPTHVYDDYGTYNVRTEVTDIEGNKALSSSEIRIYKDAIESIKVKHPYLSDAAPDYDLVLILNGYRQYFSEEFVEPHTKIFDPSKSIPLEDHKLRLEINITHNNNNGWVSNFYEYDFELNLTDSLTFEPQSIILHQMDNGEPVEVTLNMEPICSK